VSTKLFITPEQHFYTLNKLGNLDGFVIRVFDKRHFKKLVTGLAPAPELVVKIPDRDLAKVRILI
jgi:hypothetical protein